MDLMNLFPQAPAPSRNQVRPVENNPRKTEEVEPSAVSFPTMLQETKQPIQTGDSKKHAQGTQEKSAKVETGKGSENAITTTLKTGSIQANAKAINLKGKMALLNGKTEEGITPTSTPSVADGKTSILKPAQAMTQTVVSELEIEAAPSPKNTLATEAATSATSKFPGTANISAEAVTTKDANELPSGLKPAVQGDETVKSPTTKEVNLSQLNTDGKTAVLKPSQETIGANPSVIKDLPTPVGKTEIPAAPSGMVKPEVSETFKPMDTAQTLEKDQNLAAKPTLEKAEQLPLDEKIEVVAVDKKVKTEEVSVEKAPAETVSKNTPSLPEIEQLSAQSKAQKVYQQPVVATDSTGTAKTTLADLDLDSGTSGSQSSKQDSISRLLSSTSKPSVAQSSVKGQVLTQVVKHLQEEMGREKLTIRLNPEKLGLVDIQFQTKGDNLNIIMSASNPEAEGVIKEGARELAENIADKSMRWNVVDVRVDNRGQEQSKQESRQNERREKQDDETKQKHQGRQNKQNQQNTTGAGEWAAFHLGG